MISIMGTPVVGVEATHDIAVQIMTMVVMMGVDADVSGLVMAKQRQIFRVT